MFRIWMYGKLGESRKNIFVVSRMLLDCSVCDWMEEAERGR